MLNQVTLSGLQYMQGILTFIFVLISFVLGVSIVFKYFKFRNTQLLMVGLTWLFLVSGYWPDAINFILILGTGNEINEAAYFFIANFFIPFLHITWGLVVTEFVLNKRKKIIMTILSIEAVIFEIAFIIVFEIDYTLIGTKIEPFVVEWADFVMIYLLLSTLIFLVLGILFCRESLKSDSEEIRLKGKFLLIAFILFSCGVITDVLFVDFPSGFFIALARIFVIAAAFAFYIGFTLPRFIKEIFIKDRS